MRPVSRLEPLIPIAMAATLLLPWSAALVGFGILAVIWGFMRRGSDRGTLLALSIGLVVVLLGLETVRSFAARDTRDLRDQAEAGYNELWQELDEAASQGIAELGEFAVLRAHPREIFEILGTQARHDRPAALTLILIDAGGDVFAWGGSGLLHEIASLRSVDGGRHHVASFSAVTLVVVRPFQAAGQTWYLAAGRSLRTDSFPFAGTSSSSPVWTVVPEGTDLDPGVVRIPSDPGPDLVFSIPADSGSSGRDSQRNGLRRAAGLFWGLTLLVLVWAWTPSVGTFVGAWVLVTGLVQMSLMAGTPVWATVLLAASGALAYTFQRWKVRTRSKVWSLLLGISAATAVPVLSSVTWRFAELPDLGGELWSGMGSFVVRAALALVVWVLLELAPAPEGRARGSSQLLLWLSLLAVVVSGATLDRPVLGGSLLVVSGVCLTAWKRGVANLKSGTVMTAVGVLAVLLAATGWELSSRWNQKIRIEEAVLPALAPPTAAEIESMADEMESFLSSWDVSSLAPAGLESLSSQDLAFEIWSHSPLARYGGLSALRVLTRSGGLSSFSFGLPLNEENWVDWSSPLLDLVPVPAWQDAILVGDGELHVSAQRWAYAEYALALQPGFRRPAGQGEDLAEVLLRTSPARRGTPRMGLAGGRFGLFELDGHPIVSPWSRSPMLPREALRGGVSRVTTPDGPAYAFSTVGADGVRVVFLDVLSPLQSLERVGSHALAVLVILATLLFAWQLPSWTRGGLRASWFHLWHSYPRRLALVYSILLLLPLGIINLLVIRALEDRLVAEQEAAGLLAVESAQRVLGEYVLALEPGFGVDAALDDELLNWLSSVVHHDVNLYWRGLVSASSKRELFTAGLLSHRIPGEIYSGLTHLGHTASMRTNRAGRSEYLELYAPLTVPGVSFGQARLIISLPMLAQQQATAQQIASLRRRSLLGSAAVVLLIVAVGIRLARRFTTPLMDIIEGTQRIAAGEASLNLRPSELELVTLVDAIDDMALRIHAARQDLLIEKQVVDRVVENITAGVVSLDERRQVLMANRVAGEMLGLEIGQPLEAVADDEGRLAPIVDFLASVSGGELMQRTVNLKDREGNEKEWALVWVPLPGESEPSALLVLEDVTEVLRGQRLQAWAEMARMIAHEIKNPLTPIRLSTEHMREVYGSDPESFQRVFESCTINILTQVGALQEIAGEFSTYSRIPKIELERGDLVEVVREIVSAYASSSASEVEVELIAADPELEVALDAKLVGRAVRNLLENAVRAAPRGTRVEVLVEKRGDQAAVVVADNGPGVRAALLPKIFDPYFSTHDAGTGLGLPIAKRIAEEHGGQIAARNRDAGGLEVTITLPVG